MLVDRGDREVVTKVAVNNGARFSRTGMSMLAMRASGDSELTQAMTRRPDISPTLFKRLLSHATEEARQRLLEQAGPAERDAINRVLTQLANQAGSMTVSAKEFAAAQRLVYSFSQDTQQTRTKVLQFADGNRIAELVAALSNSELRADRAGLAADLRQRAVRRHGDVQGDRAGMAHRAFGHQQSARHER